jgi:ferredoxin
MAITKVWIDEGCNLCGVCESICPDVFVMEDETAAVADGADFAANEACIEESAESCPVEVIHFE